MLQPLSAAYHPGPEKQKQPQPSTAAGGTATASGTTSLSSAVSLRALSVRRARLTGASGRRSTHLIDASVARDR